MILNSGSVAVAGKGHRNIHILSQTQLWVNVCRYPGELHWQSSSSSLHPLPLSQSPYRSQQPYNHHNSCLPYAPFQGLSPLMPTVVIWAQPWSILCQIGLSRYLQTLTSRHDTQGLASECPDVKKTDAASKVVVIIIIINIILRWNF